MIAGALQSGCEYASNAKDQGNSGYTWRALLATTLPSSCAICAVAFSFAPVIWTWTTAAVSDEESRSLLEATACLRTESLKKALRQVQGAHCGGSLLGQQESLSLELTAA